ncbi:MAG: glycosyltransferase family 4 protein [Nitrospirota bacterium]|nr:glycosyltransferase family 4 protein [Nitrospirota bacterium]
MKILMVAPQPFFEARGTPISVLGRLRALSTLGHQIDLVTYHIGQDVAIPGVAIFRTLRIPFMKQVPIGPSLRKVFLDCFVLLKTMRMLITKKYDLIHTHEEACFFGYVLAKWFGIPHVYDMHSSLPQQLRNFEYAKYSLLIRVFQWLEQKVINSSQAVITICPALRDHVQRINAGVPQILIENVPTEGNPDDVTAEESRNFTATYSLEGKIIVLYAGTFEPYQGLNLLISSAERVIRKIPNVVFVLMGGNPKQFEVYQNQVADIGLLSNFRFTGMRPTHEIPKAIRSCNVLVSPRISGTNTPLKIYGYLQSGKPIVATNLYTHTQVLNSEVAMLVDPNPQTFAEGICAVLESTGLASSLGEHARKMFDQQYSFQTFLDLTDQVIQFARSVDSQHQALPTLQV